MRINLEQTLLLAIRAEQSIAARLHSSSLEAIDDLIKGMPSPVWAETARGCALYYPGEVEMNHALNELRKHVLNWYAWLLQEGLFDEPQNEWPQPKRLAEAIEALRQSVPQKASVS